MGRKFVIELPDDTSEVELVGALAEGFAGVCAQLDLGAVGALIAQDHYVLLHRMPDWCAASFDGNREGVQYRLDEESTEQRVSDLLLTERVGEALSGAGRTLTDMADKLHRSLGDARNRITELDGDVLEQLICDKN